MKIGEARQAYSAQLNALQAQRQALTKTLKDQESGASQLSSSDRLELTKELEDINAEYGETQKGMEAIMTKRMAIQNAEAARQQGEALAKESETMGKMLAIYRRIASGGRVPPRDEKALMEYNNELYQSAKLMAIMKKEEKEKKYDSLLDDEDEESGAQLSPEEAADNAEINIAPPKAASVDINA